MLRGFQIERDAIRKIRNFMRLTPGRETGGPMVGFVTEKGVLIVKDLSGPGPQGTCSKFTVTIDGEHSQEFCDRTHYESKGVWDYVGDWHCHPGFSLRPSEDDSEAMRLLANTTGIVSNPVSLIYSRFRRAYRVYEWDSVNDLLREIDRM